jgi:phospholipid/cholesterol/gamma-HCH transport system permease protein
MAANNAGFDLREQDGAQVIALTGDWTVWTIASVEAQWREALARADGNVKIALDGLGKIDMAGAYLIDRAAKGPNLIGGDEGARKLIEAVRAAPDAKPPPTSHVPGIVQLFERTGRAVHSAFEEGLATLSFMGLTLATLGRLALRPHKIRWASTFHVMETAGLNAVPIIVLLSFFVGIVVAYLGARSLADFGASIFTVELVAVSVLREFGVVIACVLLAGRTDSAFTAEIGSMKMRQEIDALRVLGMDPIETLVAPRVLAMLIMTPILTFISMLAGLAGGILVCWSNLNVSPVLFLARIQDLPSEHFWVGMLKTPVFAFVLALVGCRHGLETGGDVASLGARVTSSVVQSIFLVVVLDAVFALWFLEMGW